MSTDAYGLRINMCRCQHPLECVLILSRDLCTVCHARVFLGNIQRLVVPIETSVQMSSGGCDETDHTYRSRFKSWIVTARTAAFILDYWKAPWIAPRTICCSNALTITVFAFLTTVRSYTGERWLSTCAGMPTDILNFTAMCLVLG